MTAQQPFAGDDPWFTGLPADPRTVTRAELIELAARVLMGYSPDHVWTEADLGPISAFDDETSSRDLFVGYATEALDATYPVVRTEAEIEALGWMTVVVNGQGSVRERVIAPDNHLDHGGKPWSTPGSDRGRHRVGQTSASLAMSGPWTVVVRRTS